MKILKDIKLHFITVILFGIMFPVLIFLIGLLFPSQSKGIPIYQDNKLVGYENIGQYFYSDKYFWGRPSEVNYNAKSAGASNKGPTNPEYLVQVENRIKEFLLINPTIKREQIPSDLVTGSGSGLDPHISSQAALIQIERVAKARNIIDREKILKLVNNNIEEPLLGIFGPKNINVLKLNMALDKLNNNDLE
ncbi:MAG: potassium-transporting ATPase subunit KdpC [Melioribacteraceae bacterium]|nr:potassium-transporting ATPase subunit KdpC [Melioribacteraceae bacterium]